MSSTGPAGTSELTDKDISNLSSMIGSEWKRLGIELGYSNAQLDQLQEQNQKDIHTCICTMLCRWRDVIVDPEFGERPRLALAFCLLEQDNTMLAEEVTRDTKAAKAYQMKPAAEAAVQKIIFSIRPSVSGGKLNIGSAGGFNQFGGTLKFKSYTGALPSVGSGGSRSGDDVVDSMQAQSLTSSNMQSLSSSFSSISVSGPSSFALHDVNAEIEVYPPPTHSQMSTSSSAASISSSASGGGELKKSNDDCQSETVADELSKWMKSVCQIISPETTGTGFRVGDDYLLTAWHVVRAIVEHKQFFSTVRDPKRLSRNEVFVDFSCNAITNRLMETRFCLEPDIPFIDEVLDVAVLRIKKEQMPLRPQFTSFLDAAGISEVTFLGFGHPGTQEKVFDPRCKAILQNAEEIKAARAYVEQNRDRFRATLSSVGKDPGLVDQAYLNIEAEGRVLYNCYQEQGGSGSPAMVISPRGTEVVAMLTNGYPAFLWELPKAEQASFPKEYRMEMATNIIAIVKSMQDQNCPIRNNIFGV